MLEIFFKSGSIEALQRSNWPKKRQSKKIKIALLQSTF
jgi:hypothetical protein